MRWKEFSLWLGFLFLCFASGYLHGHLPDVRLQFLFSGAEKVRIVVFEKSLLTPALIKTLEDKTHTEIQIEEVKNWDEARLKTVLTPGADLLFLPSHWIPPLIREGRLRTITSMKSLIEKEIAPELRFLNSEKIYTAPLFWTLLELRFPVELQNEEPEKALENTKIRSIHLYHDPELAKLRLVGEPWNYPKIKSKVHLDAEINLLVSPHHADEVTETSLHQDKNLSQVFIQTINKKPLLIFSLAVPNNSPKRSTSLALIDSLLTSDEFDSLYASLPVGSALTRLDNKLPERMKRASFLKELSFKEIDLPIMRVE